MSKGCALRLALPIYLFNRPRFNNCKSPFGPRANASRDWRCWRGLVLELRVRQDRTGALQGLLNLNERGIAAKRPHSATKLHPAQAVGPNAEPMRTLLLRYHIAVRPVLELNRTKSG